MLFEDLNLNRFILKSIRDKEYNTPTKVQEESIPALLKGFDLIGCVHTGSGKTAAFAIPILEMLSRKFDEVDHFNNIRALVLAPTRELAIQIGESFEAYGKYLELRIGVVFGGITPKRHIKVLKREPHILVATPGRLLDLMAKGYVDLKHINFFVLDEADRMLDKRTLDDVRLIISELPLKRQNILFSATMAKSLTKIANTILKDPIKIDDKDLSLEKAKIKQQVYFIEEPEKINYLLSLLSDPLMESVLVFTRTKKIADKVCKAINIQNIRSKAIHGDKNQSERMKALELFKNKEIRVLVATDVAARGIDINAISHVINMDIPNIAETYIHRIGRTGRASHKGIAISLCSEKEIEYLKEIELLQGKSLEHINK